MIPRLHAPLVHDDDTTVTLVDDEGHYARHVLRLTSGDAVRIFDGSGREWHGTIGTVSRSSVAVIVGLPASPAPEPLTSVTLAIAVLKTDYMDEAIRDAAMIGVARVQPLVTARSVASRAVAAGSGLDRWRRIALAAVRQSGRAVVPTIDAPVAFDRWLEQDADASHVCLLLSEPRLAPGRAVDLQALRDRAHRQGVTLLVGPEGGWDDREVAAAGTAGFEPWTVSRRILRADAVAVAALSVLFYAWDQDG